MEQLIKIQAELKAPKGQFNKFGGYAYRSCEDILEAVKPLLKEAKCSLVVSDEIQAVPCQTVIADDKVMAADRIYVKARAALYDDKGDLIAETTAYAREALDKKGMDAAQITGSASSYARKYALNGLFLIDDTKDADATNKHGKGDNGAPKPEPEPTLPPLDMSTIESEQGHAFLKSKFGSAHDAIVYFSQTRTVSLENEARINEIGEEHNLWEQKV